MKRLLLNGLLVLFVSALPSFPARADSSANDPAYRIEPFTLVHLGYQGYFAQEGIPSNASFISAVELGKITPTVLVKSAIEHGRLPGSAIEDTRYLDLIATQLKFIEMR